MKSGVMSSLKVIFTGWCDQSESVGGEAEQENVRENNHNVPESSSSTAKPRLDRK